MVNLSEAITYKLHSHTSLYMDYGSLQRTAQNDSIKTTSQQYYQYLITSLKTEFFLNMVLH